MWTKARNVMRTCKYCDNICLRISRAVAETKLSTKLRNARILTELQPVQNLRIFSNNLMMFKIDLRKLWSHRPLWSLKPAHHRSRFKAASSFFFFSLLGCFDPLCVRSPLDTLESGVLFHIWWLSKQLLVLHDGPPWKVSLCLPCKLQKKAAFAASAEQAKYALKVS